jgi:hypothetical protein
MTPEQHELALKLVEELKNKKEELATWKEVMLGGIYPEWFRFGVVYSGFSISQDEFKGLAALCMARLEDQIKKLTDDFSKL